MAAEGITEKLQGSVQGGACLQGALVPAGRGSEAGGGFQVMSCRWSWARTLGSTQGGGGERALGRQACAREPQEPPRRTDRWRCTVRAARVDKQTFSPADARPRADLGSPAGRPSCKQHTGTRRPQLPAQRARQADPQSYCHGHAP